MSITLESLAYAQLEWSALVRKLANEAHDEGINALKTPISTWLHGKYKPPHGQRGKLVNAISEEMGFQQHKRDQRRCNHPIKTEAINAKLWGRFRHRRRYNDMKQRAVGEATGLYQKHFDGGYGSHNLRDSIFFRHHNHLVVAFQTSYPYKKCLVVKHNRDASLYKLPDSIPLTSIPMLMFSLLPKDLQVRHLDGETRIRVDIVNMEISVNDGEEKYPIGLKKYADYITHPASPDETPTLIDRNTSFYVYGVANPVEADD